MNNNDLAKQAYAVWQKEMRSTPWDELTPYVQQTWVKTTRFIVGKIMEDIKHIYRCPRCFKSP